MERNVHSNSLLEDVLDRGAGGISFTMTEPKSGEDIGDSCDIAQKLGYPPEATKRLLEQVEELENDNHYEVTRRELAHQSGEDPQVKRIQVTIRMA